MSDNERVAPQNALVRNYAMLSESTPKLAGSMIPKKGLNVVKSLLKMNHFSTYRQVDLEAFPRYCSLYPFFGVKKKDQGVQLEANKPSNHSSTTQES